jgi:hypothetical protein
VVRERSAKPLCAGSIPARASIPFTGHLSHANVKGEVRVLALCDAHGVVQRGGYMGAHKRVRRRTAELCGLALIERRVQQGVQIHRSLGLLRESRRGYRCDPMAEGQRNAQTAEEPSAKASALAADAEDGGIGGLPAEVQQERNWWMQPGLGDANVHVPVGVRLVRSRQLLVGRARDKVVASADQAADGHARHPGAELAILDSHDLAVKDVHAGVVPQVAETERRGRGGGLVAELMHAARVAGLGAAVKSLRDAEGLNISNDLRGIDEVEADGRVRKYVCPFSM